MKRHDRGSALAVALIIIVLLMGMGIALATFSFPFINRTGQMNDPIRGSYAAEAMLEKVWYEITTSNYNAVGNIWLTSNSGPTPNGVLVYSNVPIGQSTVNVRIYDLGNLFYRAEATATLNGTSTTVAQEYRARDTFARYMFFTDTQTIYFGTTTVRGYVHDNQGVGFNFGGAKFYKEVDAVTGFIYGNGATQANTTFLDGFDDSASTVPMPNTNEIATLHQSALSTYKFMGQNDLVKVTFMGNQVRMVATSQTGVLLSDTTQPLPSNGLIFIQGNFEVQGNVSGRVTIASMGAGTVTGQLIYTDQDGDKPYQLKNSSGTVINDLQSTGTAKWIEPNYTYTANPSYNPNPNAVPALGIMLQNDLTVGPMAPYNMEMMAAVFSSQGNWHMDLSTVKGNLRVNGSLVSKNRGWRYSSSNGGATWMGWGASGEYNYDDNLLNNPPPFYLKVDKPKNGARWKMNRSEVTFP